MGKERHPTADRPLIDYSTCALLVPCQLMGTVIGVIVNGIIPEWLITLLLFTMLVLMTVQTTSKGIKLYQHESKLESKHESKATPEELRAKGKLYDGGSLAASGTESGTASEVTLLLEADKTPDYAKLSSLAALWVMLIATAFVKGGPAVPWDLNIKCGTTVWWIMVTSIAPASSK